MRKKIYRVIKVLEWVSISEMLAPDDYTEHDYFDFDDEDIPKKQGEQICEAVNAVLKSLLDPHTVYYKGGQIHLR